MCFEWEKNVNKNVWKINWLIFSLCAPFFSETVQTNKLTNKWINIEKKHDKIQPKLDCTLLQHSCIQIHTKPILNALVYICEVLFCLRYRIHTETNQFYFFLFLSAMFFLSDSHQWPCIRLNLTFIYIGDWCTHYWNE